MRALRQSPRPVRGALHLHRGHAWHAQARLGLKPVESRGPSQAPARPLAEVAVRGLKGWWSSGRGGGDPGVHCWEPWWGRQTRGADLWGRRVLEAAVASFHRPALLPHEVRLCAVSCHLLTARLLGLQNPVGHRPRRQGATPAQGLCGGGDIGRICEEEGSLGLSTGADVSGGGGTQTLRLRVWDFVGPGGWKTYLPRLDCALGVEGGLSWRRELTPGGSVPLPQSPCLPSGGEISTLGLPSPGF